MKIIPSHLSGSLRKPLLFVAAIAAAAAVLAPNARGAFLANGDLEALDPGEPLFESWTNGGGVALATQPIAGEHSPRIERNTGDAGNALNQNTVDPLEVLSIFSLSCEFAASDPGGADSRSLHLSLRSVPGSDGGNINLRVVSGSQPGRGTVQVYDGVWQTALANAVAFSSAESGDGFVVNTMTIDADYTGATPVYSVAVNGDVSPELSFFQGEPPAPGATLSQISLQSGNLATGSWSVVDNVALDSPAAPLEPQTFEQWRRAHFTVEERDDETISGAGADPAGDGVPNLLKFAFGLEPKTAARKSLPVPELAGCGLRLTYPRARDAVGVELVVEVSSDLVAWESGENFTEEIAVDESGDVDLVTVRVLPPLSGAERASVRVRATRRDGILWGVMDWMIDPNAFPDTDTSPTRPLFGDGGARMITHQYQGSNWLPFKLSPENKDEIERIYDAGHCINLMLYFVSCTYDEGTDTFSYPLNDQFLDDFAELVDAYKVGEGPLYIQAFPEFELWYSGKDAALQDKYRAKIRSHFEAMAGIARSKSNKALIGLSFMGLFMADADSHFASRWGPIISNSDLVYINFMTPAMGVFVKPVVYDFCFRSSVAGCLGCLM